MSNIEKIEEFLSNAQVFYVLTTDGEQPKGRPFATHLLYDGKIYFCCGTFKNVFKQLTANPKVEILALNGMDFLRYDGIATVVNNDIIESKFRENSQVADVYEANGWKRGVFYLEKGHAEIRSAMKLIEEFDV